MRLSITCKWFGICLLLTSRKFGPWHDHDWDAWTFALGPIDEEVEVNYSYTKVNRKWFVNRVPFTKWHSVRFPWAMLIVHGRQRQLHTEAARCDSERL